MKTKIKSIAIACVLSLCGFLTYGQEKAKTRYSLEIDPATFVFNGYSIHLRVQPKNSKHLLIGAGAYAMNMPAPFVDMNKANRDKGWDVRLNQGYGLFTEYYLSEVNKRWFLGAQVGLQEYKIENENVEGSKKFTNLLSMAYAGYAIRPFDFNLYIKPWAGVGYTSKLSGESTLGDRSYDIAPITMFATLHVGFTL